MITILDYTTKTPLQLMGYMAGTCWGSPLDDPEKNRKRAIKCIEDNHGRVEEMPDVYCVIEGFSGKCLRELYTHIGGSPTRLQASTRYIDYEKGFTAIKPKTVKGPAETAWNKAIEHIKDDMKNLKSCEVAKEDYTNLLPLAYESKMVWKVNARTLVNFFNKRLCNRAYWEIRNLANELKKALEEYSDEWKTISKMLFVPDCEKYLFLNPNLAFCCESQCCGKHKWIKDLKVV
jgi:thymidylate synthase (FAD)